MPAIIEGPPDPEAAKRPLWRRLAWFFGMATAGALTTALAAFGLKLLLHP
jgi:hypothetical protein